ncbi:MAG: EpsI family protein [Rubrivivax sp.]|nr:EpsI family protein [Rubrivivax sp.]
MNPSLVANMRSPVPLLRGMVLLGVLLGALALAEWMRPTEYLARTRAPIELSKQVPKAFGGWREADFMQPVLPNPEMQSRLDELYTQVLARTYIGPRDQIVMLSIAYGSDQGSEATAVHRPEFCYTAQGFSVKTQGRSILRLPNSRDLELQRLLARQGARVEPVMYWVTLDDIATLPGLGRKLAQLGFGIRGQIADGMLVRVSTVSGGTMEQQFEAQQEFLRELFSAMPGPVRNRYFGS